MFWQIIGTMVLGGTLLALIAKFLEEGLGGVIPNFISAILWWTIALEVPAALILAILHLWKLV